MKNINYKKVLWPFNVITFNLSRFSPIRDSNIWLFGALAGRKYDDNSRFLFEYTIKKNSKIRCVWLSKRPQVVELIRSLGYEAYITHSLKGLIIQLRAGAVFYTHGLDDLGFFPLVGGAKIFCLWHGFSFKRIYNSNYSGLKKSIKLFADFIFNWVYRDYSMVSSQYVKEQFISEFGIKDPNTIFITGQPRNDLLFMGLKKVDVLDNSVLRKIRDRKIILFMPTYRVCDKEQHVVRSMVMDLVDDVHFNHFLADNNYVFVIKLHPLTAGFPIGENDNFILMEYKDIRINQALLSLGDVLVTDYSGVFVDYALLNRPIIFYSPDDIRLSQTAESQESDFETVSSMCKANNIDELICSIQKPNLEMVSLINDYFSEPQLAMTSFRENVYEKAISMVFS